MKGTMKRISAALCVALALVIGMVSCGGKSSGKSVVGAYYTAAKDKVYVSDDAGMETLAILAKGDKVTVLETEESGAYKVKTADGITGWVSASDLVIPPVAKAPQKAEQKPAAAKASNTAAPAIDLSKDGKALGEKILSLEKDKAAVEENLMNEAFSKVAEMDEYEARQYGQSVGKAIAEQQGKIDTQLKPLYALVDQLSDPEYRRYVEALGRLPEKEFDYRLTDDSKGVRITAYHGLGGEVTIPAEIEGFPVIELSMTGDRWGANRRRITSVAIPDTVTRFTSDGLFSGLNGLKAVALSMNGWRKIPDYIFRGCMALTAFTVPDGITGIGEGAFRASAIESITIPDSVTTIGEYAFDSCKNLRSVTLPKGLKVIEFRVFIKCNSLTSVTIPEGVREIGYGAFSESGLQSVTIPDSVTTIKGDAFYVCDNLTEVAISPKKRNWGNGVIFYKCPKLSLASQAAIRAAGYEGSF